MRHEDYTIKE